jgi:hypothetical protein
MEEVVHLDQAVAEHLTLAQVVQAVLALVVKDLQVVIG